MAQAAVGSARPETARFDISNDRQFQSALEEYTDAAAAVAKCPERFDELKSRAQRNFEDCADRLVTTINAIVRGIGK